MPRSVAKLVRHALDELIKESSSSYDIAKLAKYQAYRLRVENWHVIYELSEHRSAVVVLTINPRGGYTDDRSNH